MQRWIAGIGGDPKGSIVGKRLKVRGGKGSLATTPRSDKLRGSPALPGVVGLTEVTHCASERPASWCQH